MTYPRIYLVKTLWFPIISTTGHAIKTTSRIEIKIICLCVEDQITLTTISKESKTNELRKKAMKKVIELCEDSIERNDRHMIIQCPQCEKCRTCKQIREINASSYNEFVEQQVLDQLVKYEEGENGEPGYFISRLPLKPFEINTVKGNRKTADEQNRRMTNQQTNRVISDL